MAKPTTAVQADSTEERRGMRPAMWWGAATLVLALGYADLARGGETIAPILLLLGYCVLIPLAILS